MRDVVVIGSGHNALVAACYLAKSGMDVEVLERDTVLGGAVSTVERFPGYLMDRGSSAHIMIRQTGIIEELGLDVRYDDLDPWGFAPFWTESGEQVALTFWHDLDRTCTSIAAVCGAADADAYRAFVLDWGARNRHVLTAFTDRPTPGRLGRAIWGAGRGTGSSGLELAREFLGSGDALLDAHFTDERLKTALAWMGAQSGPAMHEVGTADFVGWLPMLHHTPPGHPHGGSGALTQALAERLRSDGGRIRLSDGAAEIVAVHGRAIGVRTDSGELLRSRIVLAGCHILHTLDLLGAAAPGRRSEVRVGNGIGMVVRLGTSALPRYPSAGPEAHRALQLLAPDRTFLRAAYGDFLGGRAPQRPAALAMSFSALDPSIAPPGRHNISIWGQWHPYALATGEQWPSIADREADKLIAEVDRMAPGFAGSVEHVHIQTPLDIERELRLPRANVMHVEMSLDSMFAL
ncbi:MAG TPA: NAD(P)/FAD-dependent oxidoreductase, partial [Mycobacteriales bacterium]|nr:NAD(P)/FAD-dependent oxidoreductase [Mycobacteriales bacterium]